MPCYLQSLSLKPELRSRHATPQAESSAPSPARSEAGQTRRARNAGWGPGAWGAFRRPQARGQVCATRRPSSLGAGRLLTNLLHHLVPTGWRGTREVVVCLPVLARKPSAPEGAACGGAERGEQEEGRAGHLQRASPAPCTSRLWGAGKLGQADGLKLARLATSLPAPGVCCGDGGGGDFKGGFSTSAASALRMSRARPLPGNSPHPVVSPPPALPGRASPGTDHTQSRGTQSCVKDTSGGPPRSPPLLVVPPHLTLSR